MVAPVTARLVPAFGTRASPHHSTSSACPNFCAAGTTGRRSCVQSATVGKDSSEPPFAVHSMPTVRNRCACFLHDASSRMCLPAGLIHGKEGCALQLFEPSALWSTANSWCRRKKNAARNLHQRKYNVFLILCPWRAKGPIPQLVRAAPRRIWSQGQQRARRRFKLCFINRTDTALPGTAVWEEILMGVEI